MGNGFQEVVIFWIVVLFLIGVGFGALISWGFS